MHDAHSAKDLDCNALMLNEWKSLFTPLGNDPETHCLRQTYPKCQALDPKHGHLNKVASWTGDFAARILPNGPVHDTAREWGYTTGLWDHLEKLPL